MDEFDRRILNLTQGDFPIVPNPFAVIAERVGLQEEDVLARMTKMKEEGIIRRIGAIFDSRKLGYVSVLCAASVSAAQEGVFINAVNACPGVTHHYRRSDDYNMWFTLISPSEKDLEATVEGIRQQTGADILCLRAVRTFKINAQFDV